MLANAEGMGMDGTVLPPPSTVLEDYQRQMECIGMYCTPVQGGFALPDFRPETEKISSQPVLVSCVQEY